MLNASANWACDKPVFSRACTTSFGSTFVVRTAQPAFISRTDCNKVGGNVRLGRMHINDVQTLDIRPAPQRDQLCQRIHHGRTPANEYRTVDCRKS
jgi:hypothetical protein